MAVKLFVSCGRDIVLAPQTWEHVPRIGDVIVLVNKIYEDEWLVTRVAWLPHAPGGELMVNVGVQLQSTGRAPSPVKAPAAFLGLDQSKEQHATPP